MSYRELWVLVQHLPQDSWTQTIIRDRQLEELVNPETTEESTEPKFGPWALLNYQLAQLADAVNWNTYITKVAGGIKEQGGKDPTPPEPTPRPGLRSPQARNPEAVVRYLEEMRAARQSRVG